MVSSVTTDQVAMSTVTLIRGRSLRSAANVLRLALEAVIALLAAAEHTTFLLELLHGDGGQFGCVMVFWSVVVRLVDGDGRMNDSGLDSLFLDYGLNGFMDMVMHVLAADGG